MGSKNITVRYSGEKIEIKNRDYQIFTQVIILKSCVIKTIDDNLCVFLHRMDLPEEIAGNLAIVFFR
jgi:hypothetical protein